MWASLKLYIVLRTAAGYAIAMRACSDDKCRALGPGPLQAIVLFPEAKGGQALNKA